MSHKKIITISLLILLILILIALYYIINKKIEHFEDKFNDFETHDEIYDTEFVNLYEIIYRDFTDIDYDTKIIYNKTLSGIKNKNNDDVHFLIGGCGVGKLCKKIKERFKNVWGVDISQNILTKAQKTYPNIKFIRGNIIKQNIFAKNQFTHIYIDERTLYYNKTSDIEEIIKNAFTWLKADGYLIAQIYDPDKLQLASRYYTSIYIDNKGNTHGFTYLNNFSHDCYYIKEENNVFNYYDKIIFDTGEKRIKKTIFTIPPKEVIYDIILNNGFDVIHIEEIRLQIVGGYELAIFKRKKTEISVNELEQKKNI
jgi:ubiquinone/menaquinone biosynthesis C-methylase UbiE